MMRLNRSWPQDERSYWMRTTYVVMAMVLVLGVLAFAMRRCLCNLLPYSARSFSGDGTISAFRYWGSRYEITFPDVPLNLAAKYVYSVRGLPSQLTFCLRVPWNGNSISFRELESRLRRLTSSANVKISITDDAGHVVCEHGSLLSDWVLSLSNVRAEFWQHTCRDIPFRRAQQYTVAVQVECSDTTVEKVVAIPILQGGGNELP